MTVVLYFTVSAIISLLLFAVLLLLAIARKSMPLIYGSIIAFFLACILGATAFYQFSYKSYKAVTKAMRPRTGMEIYTALFGKPQYDCVKVTAYQDQVIPKVDYAILLQFETCPKELNRLLAQYKYTIEKQATTNLDAVSGMATGNDWFHPQSLGDSVWVCRYTVDTGRRELTAYISTDSTKVFYIDVLD